MSNATTIVPIGNFTPTLSHRVREMAIARAQRRAVVISMQSTERYSWSALYDLAESLRATRTPYPIRLARALPRTRALLGELGIQNEWFVDADALESRVSVLVREKPCGSRGSVWRMSSPPRSVGERAASGTLLPTRSSERCLRPAKQLLTPADTWDMAINVAGTNALGDYLVSKIVNMRTLMGLAPLAQALPVASTPAANPVKSTPPATPSRTDYRAQVMAQNVLNTQTLFSMPSATGSNADMLPPIASQTPQQLSFAAIQSSYLVSQYTNITTLFSSLGTNTNTRA